MKTRQYPTQSMSEKIRNKVRTLFGAHARMSDGRYMFGSFFDAIPNVKLRVLSYRFMFRVGNKALNTVIGYTKY